MSDSYQQAKALVKHGESPAFTDEPELASRILSCRDAFYHAFDAQPEIFVRSPGRAEIIGNHTDYNYGYALAACISRSVLAVFRQRGDDIVRIASDAYPGSPVSFDIRGILPDPIHKWTNYARAVVQELLNYGAQLRGADIYLGSNVPNSGGISSSAAVELAVAVGMDKLYGLEIDPLKLALICKDAENGPIVGTPCGLLDQATVALGQSGKMVLLDFLPTPTSPLSVELVNADYLSEKYSFVIAVDPEVKRNLGDTGYPARRRMCEASVVVLSELIGTRLHSLRDLTVEHFEKYRDALVEQGGEVMRMRVEHIVYENQRVLDSVKALQAGDAIRFGELLTQSGRSALDLYGLDEKTPELTFLVNKARSIEGVIGTRNMGGGFSAITLSLVAKESVSRFIKVLGASYQEQYSRPLQCLEFRATQGVELM